MAKAGQKTGSSGWGKAATPAGTVRLRFPGASAKALDDFSAGTRIGDTLFVAADEEATVNRLVRTGDEWIEQGSFALRDLLPVAWPDEEADLEGLAIDDGWLWLIGSHARTRAKVEKTDEECIDLQVLADLRDTRARCLVGRVPLVDTDAGWMPVVRDGKRRAGMLKQGKHGNAVLKALKRDPLLGPFTRVPAKEGGLDVEGVAVAGERVAMGMRGPVIATHALLLEFTVEAKKGKLRVDGPPIQRLLAMEGLGIRDLKRLGDDLLILAGPTTGLSGPCALYRWRDWAGDPPHDAHLVRLHRPERVLELPFGRGVDHPEGLALWDAAADGPAQVLVIYDSPDPRRLDAAGGVTADLFRLPA